VTFVLQYIKNRFSRYRNKLRLNEIFKINKELRFCIYLELNKYFEKQIGGENTKVLSIQVVNYLMGDDFNNVYNDSNAELKKKIDNVKNLIEVNAEEIMTNNKMIRELIIRHIKTTHYLYNQFFDKSFFEKIENKNRNQLIKKYANYVNEFPNVEDFDKYSSVAYKLIIEKRKTRNNL